MRHSPAGAVCNQNSADRVPYHKTGDPKPVSGAYAAFLLNSGAVRPVPMLVRSCRRASNTRPDVVPIRDVFEQNQRFRAALRKVF